MSFDFNRFSSFKCFMTDSQHQVRLSKKRAKLKITSKGGLHNFQANCNTDLSQNSLILCKTLPNPQKFLFFCDRKGFKDIPGWLTI
uniref:Ovule protein n=1 Tax=Strongyloides stercoralis TaxID=6248 RepID=A0A0K0E5K5_STRER